MENAGKRSYLWRKPIIIIPIVIIWAAWVFGYIHRYIFGWVLIAGSAALILALILVIFIRPLSGKKALRAAGRVLLFLALTAAISLQCFAGIVFFWLAD